MQLKPLLALLTTSLPVLTAAQPLSGETSLANSVQVMQEKPVFATDLIDSTRRAIPAELTALPPNVMEKRQLDGEIVLPLIKLLKKVLKGLAQGGGGGLGVQPEEVQVMLDELKKVRDGSHKDTMASS